MYQEEQNQPGGDTTATEPAASETPSTAASSGPADDGRYLLEPWSDRTEAGLVPELLEDGESIVAVGSGTVLRSGRLAQPRWLLVVTDRRLLCLKGKSGNRKVIKIPVNAIRAANTTGLIGKTLVLETSTGTLRVSSIKKGVADSLVMGLESVMSSD